MLLSAEGFALGIGRFWVFSASPDPTLAAGEWVQHGHAQRLLGSPPNLIWGSHTRGVPAWCWGEDPQHRWLGALPAPSLLFPYQNYLGFTPGVLGEGQRLFLLPDLLFEALIPPAQTSQPPACS